MKALQFPLSRITLFFVVGIIINANVNFSFLTTICLTIVCLIIAVMGWITAKQHLRSNLFFGVIIAILSVCCGAFTLTAHNDYLHQDHYKYLVGPKNQMHLLRVTVTEKLKTTATKQRYIANVNSFDGKSCIGKILLNIDRKTPIMGKLPIGSVIMVTGRITPHAPTYNPAQFDYGKYLDNKRVAAQLELNGASVHIIGTNKNMYYYAAAIRERIISNLQKSHFGEKELAVIAALILGQQQEIAPEIIKDYQYAGAVHVLSVSGLHVGYLMLFVNFVLSRLPKTKKANLIRVTTVLIALWTFTFIAGLSPSVIRSATMFSFVAVGMYLKRETYIFHTLLASMLSILIVSPHFLFDVGFQLSYTSLFYILWLEPYLSGLWKPKSRAIKYVRDIMTVSVAAQIGALPLSIYYFHQFPGLFFITNLIILPGLGVIMAFGVTTMLLAAVGFVPHFPSKTLEWMVWALNKTIGWIASFETFIIKDIPLNLLMMAGLYLFIVCLFLYLMTRVYNRAILMLTSLVTLQCIFIGTHWRMQSEQELTVFRCRKSSLICIRKGETIIPFSNDSTLKRIDEIRELNPYRISKFSIVAERQSIPNFLFYNGRKIYIMDSSGIYPSNLKPEVLLLTSSPKVNLERILSIHKPQIIVADASNYKSYVKLWGQTCYKQKIPFHAVAEKGYFQIR
ncbi:MAG: competence protein ComEC [Flavobacterium sp. BFFFF1]|uniref:ComEC/Rec2 family competence protein n=1 Tax=Flavobacterium sp. BFFFF1 TaxID=2015557 RepID=UPI000BD064EA|nr:ComEC/Rec2 family competence protein [Flavobacterium sp. BFFFF1]OYU82166.1 MAG: competence protein ComEC [Flavobacterium sp. BFFFF1]